MDNDKFNFADKAILNFLYASGAEVKDNTMTEEEFYAKPLTDMYIKYQANKKLEQEKKILEELNKNLVKDNE
jgi:hypothetical protein